MVRVVRVVRVELVILGLLVKEGKVIQDFLELLVKEDKEILDFLEIQEVRELQEMVE